MSKIIKVSDRFHSFLKARAEEDKRTMIATLDIVSDEIMSKYLERLAEQTAELTCPEHGVLKTDCAIMVHKRRSLFGDA